MTLTWERLEPLVWLDAPPGPVVTALRGMPEKDRRPLAEPVAQRLAATNFGDHTSHRQALTVAAFGVIGSAGGIVRAVRYSWFEGGDVEVIVDVLCDRQPAWLPKLIPAFIRSRPFFPWWRLARALVRRGLIARPEEPEYTVRAISCATDVYFPPHNPMAALACDPGLIDEVVWRWFRTEGAGSSLATYDGWVAGRVVPHRGTWAEALAGAVQTGSIDRGRLLDETLRALAADFGGLDLLWFIHFLDLLAPTLAEVAARALAYLRLLTVDYGRAVAVGLAAARQLHGRGALDVPAFLRVAPVALVRKDKKAPLGVLRFLERLAADPRHRDAALACAAQAFGHRDPGVQEAARELIAPRLDLLSRITVSEIRDAAAAAAPSLAPRLRPLLGEDGPDTPAAPTSPATAGPYKVPPFPEPITEPEALARELAVLLDGSGGPLALERALDACARFGSLPAQELRPWLGPLAARYDWRQVLDTDAVERSTDGVPLSLQFWLAELLGALVDRAQPVLDWLPGTVASSLGRLATFSLGITPYGLMALRVHELAVRILWGRAHALLATPTRCDGTIDVEVHERRLAALAAGGAELWPADAAQARVRLRGPGRAPGMTAQPRVVGWERYPSGRSPRAAGYLLAELRASEAQMHDTGVLAVLAGPYAMRRESVRATSGAAQYAPSWIGAARQDLWPWLTPAEPDLVLAHWLPALNREATNRSLSGPSVTPLLDWLRLTDGYHAELLPACLALALSSTRAGTRLLAAEVVAAAIRDGRLAPRRLAATVPELAAAGLVKVRRLAEAVRTIGDEDARTAWRLLAELLPALLDDPPRDTAAILTVACDAAAGAGARALPRGLHELAARPGTTNLHCEARRLTQILDSV